MSAARKKLAAALKMKRGVGGRGGDTYAGAKGGYGPASDDGGGGDPGQQPPRGPPGRAGKLALAVLKRHKASTQVDGF